MVLSRLYPERFFLCVALVLLDVGSHWLQMYSQLLASKSSHKDVDRSAFFLLRLYYTNRIFMGVCCVSAEVLYLCALAASDEKGVGAVAGVPALVAILPASVGVPGTTLRATGLRTDAAAVQIAILALPGWALKQIANVAQLKASGDALVRHDARARRKTP
jgi:CDP-diacylglycerol--inositol 3-phosphatidyltransferase|tara:strand:- start:6 stop:488 length:483 start_codon:yes stop_codon:yes gene_type:complete